MKTPIVFIVFNRPETTKVVFDAIRQAKPKKLLIIADGPRDYKPDEAEDCQQVRSIVQKVDWDCELLTNFSETNLGCRERVFSGLSWAFDLVEEAIILEDDCAPHPTFFRYCEELLNYYRTDIRVTAICGENAQFGREVTPYSYYFSRYFHGWGWASWRRAWQSYDIHMEQWPNVKGSVEFDGLFSDRWVKRHWEQLFDAVYDGEIKTCWDYQWIFYNFVQNGLSVIPRENLVSNLGFGENATHTHDTGHLFANVETSPMAFPLKHQPFMIRNAAADNYEELTKFYVPDATKRVKISVKEALKRVLPTLK